MSYTYEGRSASMRRAVTIADEIMTSDEFWSAVLARTKPFYNTSRSVADIVERVRAAWSGSQKIVEWKPSIFKRLHYRNTVAFVDNNQADTLFYHTRFLGNPVGAMVNTLVHEFVHIVDRYHDSSPNWDFTHAGQKAYDPPENQDSAPYWIGNAAEQEYARRSQPTTERTSFAIDFDAVFEPSPIRCGTGGAEAGDGDRD